MNEQQTMIDIETLSNRHEDGVIMSLAAVKFVLNGPLIDCRQPIPMDNMESDQELYCIIDVNASRDAGYGIEKETYDWWMSDPERAAELQRMMNYPSAIGVAEAMTRLERFVKKTSDIETVNYGWSHGAGYDMVFIANRFKQLLGKDRDPFDHHHVMDTRTLLTTHKRLRGFDITWPEVRMKHHPLDDARRQARVVQETWRSLLAAMMMI